MFGLQIIDILVISVYFIVVMLIGLISMRRVRNLEGYFLGNRSFGKIIQTFAAFGQGTSSENAVGATTTVFTNGIAGIWSSLLHIFTTPIYWLTSPWYRRLRVLTMGEFFKERYQSQKMSMLYAVMATFGLMLFITVGISAMSKTIIGLTPKDEAVLSIEELSEIKLAKDLNDLESIDYLILSDPESTRLEELQQLKPRASFSHINEIYLVIFVCIIIIIYGALGGLHAAFLTDFLQGFFIIILSIILLPFAIMKVNHLYGGNSISDAFTILHQQLPQSDFALYGSSSTLDFTWYYIASLCLLVAMNVAVQPNQLVATGSAKNEFTARFGFVTGSLMKRAVTILWGITALVALLLYRDQIRNPDLVWGYMTLDLLGPLNMGLVGLMIACLMSALMSTADCLMITASGLLTNDLYRQIFKNRNEKHYLLVGRLAGVLMIAGSAYIALSFSNIFTLLKFTLGFFSMFAASFWLGITWRRPTARAAWFSIWISAFIFVIIPSVLPNIFPAMRYSESLHAKTKDRLLTKYYIATQFDVDNSVKDLQASPKTKSLQVGQTIKRVRSELGKSVFWNEGISTEISHMNIHNR